MANPFASGYVKPQTNNNNYLNFKEQGNYLFRILTPKEQVVTYYRGFRLDAPEGESKKVILPDLGDGQIPQPPKNYKMKVFKNENPMKLVWAFVVFNHDLNKVQVLEVHQSQLRESLFAIASGKLKNDWTKYDIQVSRIGEGPETKYTLVIGDSEELSKEAKKIIAETPVNLSAMEKGKNPFEIDEYDQAVANGEIIDDELPEIDN